MFRRILSYLLSSFICSCTSILTTYDPYQSYRSWSMCKISYCPPTEIANWKCRDCTKFNLSHVETFQASGGLAYVGCDESNTGLVDTECQRIVVVFRGTINIVGWLHDFDMHLVPLIYCPQNQTCGKVHHGIQAAFEALRLDGLNKYLVHLSEAYNVTKIDVVGHSLGAALTVMFASSLHVEPVDLWYKVGLIYGFGQPRVGDREFADWYSSTKPGRAHVRIVHRHDPIPIEPPMEFGYVHSGVVAYYPDDSRYNASQYITCTAPEDPTCKLSSILTANVLDHLVYLGIGNGCTYRG